MGLRAAPTEDTGVSAAEVVFGAPLVLPGQILDTGEPQPADFIAKLRQSGPPPPSRPPPTRRWRPSRRRPFSQRHSSMSARAAPSLPCRRFTAARTESSPPARRFSGCRSASGRRLCPSTASSRTGGPPPSSQRSRLQEAGRELADFSSHPLPQGLVLARGPVAEQRASYLFGKSPKMCGRKIYVICLVQLFRQSCFNAPANTSYSFTLLRIISWSLQYCI